jgi:hypothetical protein
MDPGIATGPKFMEGMGAVNPVYGIWQKLQATSLPTDMLRSLFRSFPSNTNAW